MKKPVFFITILVLVAISLTIIQTVLSNRLSTTGIPMGEIEEKIDSYRLQNSILEEQLLTVSSLTGISERASQLGFVEEKSLFVMKKSYALASKP